MLLIKHDLEVLCGVRSNNVLPFTGSLFYTVENNMAAARNVWTLISFISLLDRVVPQAFLIAQFPSHMVTKSFPRRCYLTMLQLIFLSLFSSTAWLLTVR